MRWSPVPAWLSLCDSNHDGDTCGANAEVVRHSVEQGQQAAVKVDTTVKLILSTILNGDEHHFSDHPMDHLMVLVVAVGVEGASSGDPLVQHHEGDHHEI